MNKEALAQWGAVAPKLKTNKPERTNLEVVSRGNAVVGSAAVFCKALYINCVSDNERCAAYCGCDEAITVEYFSHYFCNDVVILKGIVLRHPC